MNDAVGDYDFGSGIGEREPQIIADGSGPSVALHRESEGYAAAIEADAANSAPGEKSEDTSWTATDIQHQRFRAEARRDVRTALLQSSIQRTIRNQGPDGCRQWLLFRRNHQARAAVHQRT